VVATHAIQKQISKLEKKVEEMEKLIDYAHHFLSARLEAKNDIGTNVIVTGAVSQKALSSLLFWLLYEQALCFP